MGGFKLVVLIITVHKNHMACYKISPLIGLITAFRMESKSCKGLNGSAILALPEYIFF